jgi:hypothetical protein
VCVPLVPDIDCVNEQGTRSRPGSLRMSKSTYDVFDSPDKVKSPVLTPERSLMRASR